MKKKKVLFISSTGGHLNELMQLSPLFEKYDYKIITEKESQAINPNKILQFTKSEIWKQLRKAKEYYQEKPFYINVPASKIYDEDIKENILVQGIIDLYFVNENSQIVLVDYKTDWIEEGEELKLVEKYAKQLEIYKNALEQALGKKVNKKYIYSVSMGTVLLDTSCQKEPSPLTAN